MTIAGYYWVQRRGANGWTPGYYDDGAFWVLGDRDPREEDYTFGPRLVEPVIEEASHG